MKVRNYLTLLGKIRKVHLKQETFENIESARMKLTSGIRGLRLIQQLIIFTGIQILCDRNTEIMQEN